MTNVINPGVCDSFESDKDLVDAIGRGDKSAIDCFFEKYNQLIYAQIHKRMKYVDVEDVFQDFFEYIIRNGYRVICSWHGRCKLTTWIYIVLRHFLARRIRNQQRNPGLVELNENIPDPEGPVTDLPVEILVEEIRQRLNEAIDQLSDRDRDLITHLYFLDQSRSEIASILGISMNTYYQAQFRAESRLAAVIKEAYPELIEGLV